MMIPSTKFSATSTVSQPTRYKQALEKSYEKNHFHNMQREYKAEYLTSKIEENVNAYLQTLGSEIETDMNLINQKLDKIIKKLNIQA